MTLGTSACVCFCGGFNLIQQQVCFPCVWLRTRPEETTLQQYKQSTDLIAVSTALSSLACVPKVLNKNCFVTRNGGAVLMLIYAKKGNYNGMVFQVY